MGSITLDPGTLGTVQYDLDLRLTDTTGGGKTTVYTYDHVGTLDSVNPGFFISPTLIPLEDLNGSLTRAILTNSNIRWTLWAVAM